ncbi:uncharacterized protein LOC129809138 [Phlebotomus papatasi]|uniref:uncharacterized protein LOC129809138 n=1 Tax=Phlebotomus papatasi TaxID=29031 RepID=UPI002483D55A|nr:uncharacterized protein LOC129809138 [Phlebotomus papatasi]
MAVEMVDLEMASSSTLRPARPSFPIFDMAGLLEVNKSWQHDLTSRNRLEFELKSLITSKKWLTRIFNDDFLDHTFCLQPNNEKLNLKEQPVIQWCLGSIGDQGASSLSHQFKCVKDNKRKERKRLEKLIQQPMS